MTPPLLEREGYAVTAADCAEDALTLARRDPPDLVLLDIGLPDPRRPRYVQTMRGVGYKFVGGDDLI